MRRERTEQKQVKRRKKKRGNGKRRVKKRERKESKKGEKRAEKKREEGANEENGRQKNNVNIVLFIEWVVGYSPQLQGFSEIIMMIKNFLFLVLVGKNFMPLASHSHHFSMVDPLISIPR